jgi:pimeloyl-ACP methyl ester carboxylesterase
MKKWPLTIVFFLLAWIVFAQSCMTMRITDKDAKDGFNAKGVSAEIVYQQIGNHSIHYVKTGNDTFPTLFFVHGSPGSWDAFMQYLADSDLLRRFRMISIDRPGFGYSNYGHALNLEEQSALISIVLHSIANKKSIYVVGHSLGGPMCLRLAIDNKNMFAGIVLLAAAIDPALEKPEKWRLLFMNSPLQFLVPGALRPSNYELWYLKSDLKLLKKDLATAHLPYTWMLHGDKDMLVPYENVNFARSNLDTNRLSVTTIGGANHFIPWSHYSIVKKALLHLP